MNLTFTPLTLPTEDIAAAFTRWENDPELIPFSRPNQSQEDLDNRETVTVPNLEERLKHHHFYLIYIDKQLVGEMNIQIDPPYLYKHEEGTAWIGITIGEAHARGRGVGRRAMEYLEAQINAKGLKRIELGVFEFNEPAIRLYQKLGFKEIGRIEQFTFWQGKMWQDIRMEKYI